MSHGLRHLQGWKWPRPTRSVLGDGQCHAMLVPAVAAMCAEMLCQELCAVRMLGASAEGRGLRGMAGHTEQSQRKFLPRYPRIAKTEPTQHIWGISKGIFGLLASLNKR